MAAAANLNVAQLRADAEAKAVRPRSFSKS
jgi:hypothetical protein